MQKNEANPRCHKVLKPRSDRTGSFPAPTSIYHKQINLKHIIMHALITNKFTKINLQKRIVCQNCNLQSTKKHA